MQLQSSDVAEDISSCAMLSTLSCKANERERTRFSLNYHLLVCLFLRYMLFSAKFFSREA